MTMLPFFLLRLGVPVGLGHLLEGVLAVDDRSELAGLDEIRDGAQVLSRTGARAEDHLLVAGK